MIEFPLSDWETMRLTALYQLEILDTAPEKDFDHIVSLAALVSECPMATIGFLDINRTWYKAAVGLDLKETPAAKAYQFSDKQELSAIQIEDTLWDGRLLYKTIFPLYAEDGIVLGHLSVADIKPGFLTPAKLTALEMLALQTISLLKLRLQLIKMRHVAYQSKRTLDQISPVFKNAIDAVLVIAQDGLVMQWNPRAEVMFGYKAEQAIGLYFHDLLIPPRNHQSFWNKRLGLDVNVDSPFTKDNYEFVAKRKDHTELLVAMGISPVFIDGENLFIAFLCDITAREQNTLELAKQKSFYENILNHIPTDIAVLDVDQKYLFANPFAIKDAHFREYIIGKDDFEYAVYRNRDNTVPLLRKAKFMKAKMTHSVASWEDQVTDEKGKLRTNIRNFFPVYGDAGDLSFMIGYGMDISARKKSEVEQNSLLEQLTFRNAQLNDFCNIVTHNLRGPLNNMSLLVDFVTDTNDHQEQMELVSKLKPVIEGLKTTFDDLVETIKVKQNMEIKSEMVDLEACLRKTMEGLEMEMLLANAQLNVDFNEAPLVCFPPKYIASIFYNLLSNALKYRSPDRELEINVATTRKNGFVVLTVADNGLGIDLVKYQDQVFEIGKIFHSHENAKGFGLYMTKTQVEVMGGQITVESEVNKGSTFIVVLKEQSTAC
ncbi:PAS domain S-box-containing protein [Pedobacter sp. CG_S7]|uniref:sensor histidine kinase n=1 Tax=Pedobacter sp. CG_S7 TaxID=3143930 RepID=UPI00339A1BB7